MTSSTRSALTKLRREGARGSLKRVVRRAYERVGASALDFGLLPDDIADSTRLSPVAPPRLAGDRPITVGWLTTPPAPGSGGHTTMFRMVEALERAGHRCVVLLYDRHFGTLADQARVIRTCWPNVRAEVRAVDDGFDDLDACVATGWQTAHVLARRSGPDLHRLYFIQDYEPFFCARGSEYELAADSYRFGFTNIALGDMVHHRLTTELAVPSTVVPFSCDTTVYGLRDAGPRSGVVFYAKRELPRRGYLLATLALAEFHRRHPEQEIHCYGSPTPGLPFPVTHHGRLDPEGLNGLYNRVVAGLAMSFTNISLVAEEMLAAGCIPVVNNSPDSRADLRNDLVEWALPTPGGIADALGRVVSRPDAAEQALAAAGSVRRDDWRIPGEGVVRIVEELVLGRVVMTPTGADR